MKCHRCGADRSAVIMSKFNLETICLPCKKIETKHPLYEEADRAETEAVRQDFQDAFAEDLPALVGLGVQKGENQFLPAHACGAFDVEFLGQLDQVGDFHFFQVFEVHHVVAAVGARALRPRGRGLGFGGFVVFDFRGLFGREYDED